MSTTNKRTKKGLTKFEQYVWNTATSTGQTFYEMATDLNRSEIQVIKAYNRAKAFNDANWYNLEHTNND